MKIFFDSIIYSLQNSGGISVVFSELLKRLLNDPDVNLTLIEYRNSNIFRKELEISSRSLLKIPYPQIPIYLRRYINPYISNEKGIFHSSYYRTTNSPNLVNVTTVHDFTYEYFRSGLPKFIHHIQKRDAIYKSKKIICVSDNTKKDLLKFYPNIKEHIIKVIYNGVDNIYHQLLQKDETILKQLIPFSSGEFIIFIGDRKSLYKNFYLTVNVCKITHQPLVIIGGGILTAKEDQLLKEKLGEYKFKHLGAINNIQLNLLYNHAFCLLYPSLYEGFGMPIIEAQRAGCLVVSSNYSSIPEVSGKGAVLLNDLSEYKIADTLYQLRKETLFVANLKMDGFTNAQRFSWEKCYKQTKQAYQEIYEEFF